MATPDLPMRSESWIDPADPTLELATTRDGIAVHLRPLRRDERKLVARFFAGLSVESKRRRFHQPRRGCPRPHSGGWCTSTVAAIP